MSQNEYYPEEVLIEKMQSGEYGWLDYVNLTVCNDSVAAFVRHKDEQLEAAMESGDA